jgi:adenylylsulfate kinase-like enzyme
MKPFAVWITGLPAAGKSTLAAALVARLAAAGIDAELLESDAVRAVLTPRPVFDDAERDVFYGALLHIGLRLLRRGACVVFDATANRKAYRDRARASIDRFLEIYVETPLEVCEARDPKGIYRRGRQGTAPGVPGLTTVYEPPDAPEVVVRGDRERPDDAAGRVVANLAGRGWLAPGSGVESAGQNAHDGS